MNTEQITGAVIKGLQDPTSATAMVKATNGGNAPSATTGGKNQ